MSAPTPINIALSTIEPTMGHGLRVWWSWQWRTLVSGLVLSLFCIPIVMVLNIIFGSSKIGFVAGQLLSFAVFTGAGIFQMKTVLDKEYKTFRVAILPKSPDV